MKISTFSTFKKELRKYATYTFQPIATQCDSQHCQAVLLLVETCKERQHVFHSVICRCARMPEENQMVST